MRKLTLAVALLALPLAFNACDDDDDGPVTPPAPKASLNVTHTVPDLAPVDVLIDDSRMDEDLAYTNSSGYFQVNAGSHNVKINAANTTNVIVQRDLSFPADSKSSIFIVGTNTAVETLEIVDDLSAPTAGQAKVRFLHASPTAPAIDFTTDAGTPVFTDYTFKEYSPFTSMDAGTYNFEVRPAGTSTVVYTMPNVVLAEGKIYTIYTKGLVNGTGDQAFGTELIVNN